MSHACHRICISLDPELNKDLESLSKKNRKSLSGLVIDLIHEALDFREDAYLSRLADEAEERAKGKPTVSAEELWKELGIA